MSNWIEKSNELKESLQLRTEPIAYRRLEKASDLDNIEGVTRLKQGATFCQIKFQARVLGYTVGVASEDNMYKRCKGIHGLRSHNEEDMKKEAANFAATWMPSPEEGMKQQKDYPRIPAGEAIVVAPLAQEKFDPEVILIYGNPAQIMMIMCGMQKVKYERFQFHFIGEGSCVDSLGQCYNTGKPSLAIPCYGERMLGQVANDEIDIALPPGDIDRAITGMHMLRESAIQVKYPITPIDSEMDLLPLLEQIYPDIT